MSTRTQRIWIAIFAVALTAFVVARAARKGSTSHRDKTHGALERNYEFAGRVVRGEDPYAEPQLHAPYPPSYGIVMSPLRLLPLKGARIGWALLQMVLLGLLVAHMMRWARTVDATRGPPWWVPAIAFFLVIRYLSRDTSGGGGNLVWGSLVFFAALRIDEAPGTDRRPWLGIPLGIVLAAKPTPVLFLPWLWWRGRKTTCVVAACTAAVLHASPILTLGFEGWRQAYATWIAGVSAYASQADLFATPAYDFPGFTWMHQSMRWMLERFLGTVPPEHVLDSALWFRGLGLDSTTIHGLRRVLEIAIGLITLAVLFRARKRTDPWIEAFACGLLASTTLLLSPIVWKSYHLWHFPFFFGLLMTLAVRSAPMRTHTRREIWIGLALYFVVCQLGSQMLLGDHGKEVMQSLYVVTFGAIWLWSLSLRLSLARPVQKRS